MAEMDFGTDGLALDAGALGQTDESGTGLAEGLSDGTPADRLLAEDGAPGPDDDPQYKYWQGAYTKSRQRDRERYGKLETEHTQFGEVLRNFYTSDEYALQVLRQRFPQLAGRLSLDGATAPRTSETPTGGQLEGLLAQSLGDDLAFLAPRLGPVLERVITAAVSSALAPDRQRTEQREAAERKTQEEAIFAKLDGQYPGWEARYATKMQALDAFLGSDALHHPDFGDRHELLLRLLTPDLARVEAARSMGEAARGRVTSGRAGRPGQPNVQEQARAAPNNADAWEIAAQAALRDWRRGAA